MENKLYDAAVIGMGPAGIASSIYLKRANIDFICFEKENIGGTVNKLNEIENYPSYVGNGKDLVDKFKDQLQHFDINPIKEQV